MSRFTPLLALIIAMASSSCVSNAKGSRHAGTGSPFNVWGQTPVAYSTGIYPGNFGEMLADSVDGGYGYPQAANWPYTGVSGLPEPSRFQPPLPTSYYPGDSGPRSGGGERRFSRTAGSRSLTPRSEVFPAQRHALSPINEPWRRRMTTTRGGSVADRLASASTGTRPEPEPEPATDTASAPAPSDTSKLPFAQPVPGRTGYVKLSAHPDLPEIDVRGIAPGTPVEIPNPGQSGQTIQFRVP
jgi:hypothetical protein